MDISKIGIGAAIGRGLFSALIAITAVACLAAGGAVLALTLALLTQH
jgi:hypothetical protein